MKTVKTTAILKETIGWTLTDVANNIRVSLVTIGYYKRSESMPSIDAAKKIADNFEVLLNYMVENRNLLLKKIPKHVHYLQKPSKEEKTCICFHECFLQKNNSKKN